MPWLPSHHLLASTVNLDLGALPEGRARSVAVWIGDLSFAGSLEAGLELSVLLAAARVYGTNQLHGCGGTLLKLVLLGEAVLCAALGDALDVSVVLSRALPLQVLLSDFHRVARCLTADGAWDGANPVFYSSKLRDR